MDCAFITPGAITAHVLPQFADFLIPPAAFAYIISLLTGDIPFIANSAVCHVLPLSAYALAAVYNVGVVSVEMYKAFVPSLPGIAVNVSPPSAFF